ncbi:MAG: hypothetical protein EPO24_02720 [Bacteroidetes bacterium]|nr:MAG: hypothetical protein EPO24_02720 [Bacteroidota bacterium]
MLTIKLRNITQSQVLIEKKSLLELIQVASTTEDIEVREEATDIPVEGIMTLAEKGKAFDFLYDTRQDIYTVADVKVRYK